MYSYLNKNALRVCHLSISWLLLPPIENIMTFGQREPLMLIEILGTKKKAGSFLTLLFLFRINGILFLFPSHSYAGKTSQTSPKEEHCRRFWYWGNTYQLALIICAIQ